MKKLERSYNRNQYVKYGTFADESAVRRRSNGSWRDGNEFPDNNKWLLQQAMQAFSEFESATDNHEEEVEENDMENDESLKDDVKEMIKNLS